MQGFRFGVLDSWMRLKDTGVPKKQGQEKCDSRLFSFKAVGLNG